MRAREGPAGSRVDHVPGDLRALASRDSWRKSRDDDRGDERNHAPSRHRHEVDRSDEVCQSAKSALAGKTFFCTIVVRS
jgi:hypothetical protein